MQDLSPDRASLDPGEVSSADQLAALQEQRMRWSLQHAYEQVPHYRAAFDAVGVRRRTYGSCQTCGISRSPPRPTCARTTRSGCSRLG